MVPEQFYILADQQTSSFVVKILKTRDNSVVKMHTFPGTITSPPVLSGDTATFMYKAAVTKYLVVLNIKTNAKSVKTIR